VTVLSNLIIFGMMSGLSRVQADKYSIWRKQ
jgi:hypothetical protein